MNLVSENSRLNMEEYGQKKIVLRSFPRSLFIQLDAPCNQECLFCSRPAVYKHFNLEYFKNNFEEKLMPAMERAERINLTGSGELLLLPDAKTVLNYFNKFRHSEKMFATNGSSLTPKMADYILESGNRYLIHISLHASTPETHSLMTRSDTYGLVMRNLEHLKKAKQMSGGERVKVNFIFLATTRNVAKLVEFINFAYENSADGVIVYYNYVYRQDQKELSCYFAQNETNRALDEAELFNKAFEKKYGRKIGLALPQKFRQAKYPVPDPCGEPWSQVMINPEGDIITCDVAGDSRETLKTKSFEDVWNGDYFKTIRKMLVEGGKSCSGHCLRANPSSINTFKGHVITRGKSEFELMEFLSGTE